MRVGHKAILIALYFERQQLEPLIYPIALKQFPKELADAESPAKAKTMVLNHEPLLRQNPGATPISRVKAREKVDSDS